MFVRLTFVRILPEHTKKVRKIYNDEIIPVVKRQKGLINIMLLEPTDKAEDLISITEWQSKRHAEAYESSGIYKQLVGKVMSFVTKDPVLKTYTVETVAQERPALRR